MDSRTYSTTPRFSKLVYNDLALLTFAELESFPCAWSAGLFAFYLARVAGEQAMRFERWAVCIFVNLAQGAGYSQPQRFCLSCDAAAVEVRFHIIFAFAASECKWLIYNILQYFRWEIISEFAAVDDYLAAAHAYVGTGYRCFAASGCINDFHII